MLKRGDTHDGYEMIRSIGRGGFGEVWLCRQQMTGSYQALKFIPFHASQRLLKEHQALLQYKEASQKINSPHIVRIEHISKTQDGLFYIMPLAGGIGAKQVPPEHPDWKPHTLSAHIQARKNEPTWFSPKEIVALFSPILKALQVLSESGIAHRDIKPDNILFFKKNIALGDISLLGKNTATLTKIGTPGYSPPSWFAGHPDMYGAAATLYVLLTGNQPDKMGREAFKWPPQGLSKNERKHWEYWHTLIERAISDASSEYFPDFVQFRNAFEKHFNSSPETNPDEIDLPSAAVGAVGALGIVALGALAVQAFKRKPQQQAANKPTPKTQCGQLIPSNPCRIKKRPL
jgi:serine/threonine-protein kinase